VKYVGDAGRMVSRVAVCGGSGMSFFPAALASGADAYVTADITYHRWFEALAPDGRPRIALVDAGHYETERVAERLLARIVERGCPGVSVSATATRTSPVRAFTR
jgi:putative NIF3 family GTP cyclohydrolase 1 type 2